MKKFILLFCVVALSINVMAYQPIVVDGYSWNVVSRRVQLDNNKITEYSTFSEKIDGDSIINETKTDIETITAPTTTAIQKILRNGQVFIIRDGKTYNMMGIEVENIE